MNDYAPNLFKGYITPSYPYTHWEEICAYYSNASAVWITLNRDLQFSRGLQIRCSDDRISGVFLNRNFTIEMQPRTFRGEIHGAITIFAMDPLHHRLEEAGSILISSTAESFTENGELVSKGCNRCSQNLVFGALMQFLMEQKPKH